MPRGLLQLANDDDDTNQQPTTSSSTTTNDRQNNNNKTSSPSIDPSPSSNTDLDGTSMMLFGGRTGMMSQHQQNNNNNKPGGTTQQHAASSSSSPATGGRNPQHDIPALVQRLLEVNRPFTLPGVASFMKNQYQQQNTSTNNNNNNNNALYQQGTTMINVGGQIFPHQPHHQQNQSGGGSHHQARSRSSGSSLSHQTPTRRKSNIAALNFANGTLQQQQHPLPSNQSFGGGGRLAGVPSFNILSAPSALSANNNNTNQSSSNNNKNLMNINTASAEELAALFEEIQFVRIKTSHVAIIASLHDGLDPRTIMMSMNDSANNHNHGGGGGQPTISQRERTAHTARLECWRDPLEFDTASSGGSGTMASGVAQALADQYRSISGQHQQTNSCLFHFFADVTDSDIEKGLMGVRRRADEGRGSFDAQSRIVVHYNGHGMITSPEGDLFFPNVTNTHFVPMSLSHFSNCIGSPALYVFDCDKAGGFVKYFEKNLASHPRHSKDILLCACAANEELPRNPGYPMDLFTSCLTTPLRTILLWSGHENAMLGHISATAGAAGDSDDEEELLNYYASKEGNNNNNQDGTGGVGVSSGQGIDGTNNLFSNNTNNNNNATTDALLFGSSVANKIQNNRRRPLLERPYLDIPGSTSDRKTPLGELQLILTALIDMIAWCCVSPEKFYQYFRGDTLTRHLVRNFLLADRIMREFGRRPVSYPVIAPEARQHPLWSIWEVVLDGVLCQMPMIQHDPSKYRNSTFFPDQLTAFATWLEVGDVTETNAEQLPCVMFALQKPSYYRDRALLLLGNYFETGKTAVFRGLACGALQYLPLFAKSSGYQPNLLLLNAWHQLLRVLPRIYLDENEQRLLLSILRLSAEDCRLQIVRTDGVHLQQVDPAVSGTVNTNINNSNQLSSPMSMASPNLSTGQRGLNVGGGTARNPPPLFGQQQQNNNLNSNRNQQQQHQNNNMNNNNDMNNNNKPKTIRTVLTSTTLSLTKGRTYAAHMLCTLLGYGKMIDEDMRMMDISTNAPNYIPGIMMQNSDNNSKNQSGKSGGKNTAENNNNMSSSTPSFLSTPDVNCEATAHGFWAMRLFSTTYPLLRHEEVSMRSWACLLLGCLLAFLPAAREKLASRLFENSSDEMFFSLLQDTSPSVRASCVFLLTKLIGSKLENLDHDALQRRVFLERLIMQRLFDSFSEVSRLVRREILFAAASILFHYGSLLPEILTNTHERGPDAVKPEWRQMPDEQFRRVAFSLVPADSPTRLPPSSAGSTVASHLTASGERAPITEIDRESLNPPSSPTNQKPSGGNFPSNAQMPSSSVSNNNNNPNPSSNMTRGHHNTSQYGMYQTPASTATAPGNSSSGNNNNNNNFTHPDQHLQNSRETMHSCLSEILLRDLKDAVWDAAVLLARARASSDPLISELASRVTARLATEHSCKVLPRSARARLAGLALLESTAADSDVANSEAARHRNRRNEDLARLALFHAEETGTAFSNRVNPAAIAAAAAVAAAASSSSSSTTGASSSSQQQRPRSKSQASSSQPHSPVLNPKSQATLLSAFPTSASNSPNHNNQANNNNHGDSNQQGGGGDSDQQQQWGATAAALGQNTTVECATFNSFTSCGVNSIRTGTFRLLEPHVFLADHNNKLHVIDYDRLDEPQKLFHIQLPSPIHSLHLVNDLSPSVSCILVSSTGVVSMYGGFFSTSGTYTSNGQPTPWPVGPLLSFNSATAFREHDTGYTQWSGLARRNEYLPSCFRQRDGLFAISPVLNKIQCVSLQEEKTSQILHLSCESQCSVIATDPVISSTTGPSSANNISMSGGNFNQRLYCGFADGTVRLYDQRQPHHAGGGGGGAGGTGGSLALMCVVDSTSSLSNNKQRPPKPSFNISEPNAIRHISVMNANENLIMTSSNQGGIKIWDLRKRQVVTQLYDNPNFIVPEPPQLPPALASANISTSSKNNTAANLNKIAQGSLVNSVLSQKQDIICTLRGNGGVELVRLDSTSALSSSSLTSSTSQQQNNIQVPYNLLGAASSSQTGISTSNTANFLKTGIVSHPLKPFFAVGSSMVCATNSKQRLRVTTMSM